MENYPAAPTGPEHRPPQGGTEQLLLLHGFTQTGRCWGPFGDAVASRFVLSAPDLPGHGSCSVPARLDCPGAADCLAAGSAPAHWLGYSLGGRVALHAALRHPDRVQSLVLIGATAGIDDEALRTERAELDEQRAAHLEAVGVSTFCREWLEMPMFADLPSEARFDSERRSNSVAGLAASLRNAGTGKMDPIWDELGRLAMPVLCIAGSEDRRFADHAARMVRHIGPNASLALIDDAGHAAHLERPHETADAVMAFLARPAS